MPQLFIDVQAQYAQFQDSLEKMVRHADASSRRMSSAFGTVSKVLGTLGVGLSVGAITAFTKAAIDSVARLDDFSEKSSLAVETLSQLQEVTRIGGHSLDEVAASASKFAKNISEAVGGDKNLIQFFRQVGISADDLKNKKFDELFVQFGTAVATATDKQNALAIASKLAGKSASEQMPFFKDLAELGLKQAKVTAEQVAAAEKVQKSWNELGMKSQELRDNFAIALIPALQDVATAMLNAQKAGAGFFLVMAQGLRAAVFGNERSQEMKEMNKELAKQANLQQTINDLDTGNANIVQRGYAAVTGLRKKLQTDLETSINRTRDLQDKFARAGESDMQKAALDAKKAAQPGFKIGAVRDDSADKAAAAAAKAAQEAKLRLIESTAKLAVDAEKRSAGERLAILERYYKDGIVGEERYWGERAQIQTAAFNVEKSALDKEISARQKAADIEARKSKNTKEYFDAVRELAEAQAKRNTLEAEFEQSGRLGALDKAQAAKEYADALEDVRIQLLEVRGETEKAAAARFDQANRDRRQKLAGNSDAGGLENLNALRDATVTQARFNEVRGRAAEITDALAVSEERIQNSLRTGAIGELSALKQTSDARQKSLASIRSMADELDRVAKVSGDPKLILDAERFRLKLEELAGQADLVGDKFNTIFSDNLGDMLSDVVTGTKSVSEAFRDMASNITNEITKIVSKNLAQELFGGGSGGGGLGGALGSILTGGGSSGGGFKMTGDDDGNPLAGTGNVVFDILKKVAGAFGGSFASGIDSVPRDMLAVVHKGERIVPAAANDGGGVTVNVEIGAGANADAFRRAGGQVASEVLGAMQLARIRNG